jgi:signal transduction histidine kinase
MKADFEDLDRRVARARIVLSLLATLSLYVDPSAGGLFHLEKWLLITLLCHFIYSVLTHLALTYGVRSNLGTIRKLSTGLDLFFATVITFLVEGYTSPSFIFFVFAIVAVGFRTGFRATLLVTWASVLLYLAVTALSYGFFNVYAMRAVYLAIAGYLISFFGQQRVNYEARVRELEAEAERETIARSLHDGYVQALAGVNLRIETCRELLARGRVEETLGQLRELQLGVAREYDEVRSYIRSLAGRGEGDAYELPAVDPRCSLEASFAGSGLTSEHLLQMMLEGLRNARRHGTAHRVEINLSGADNAILLTIEDDGVGFADTGDKPWAIESRVAELGGRLTVTSDKGSTRLTVEMSE